MDTYCSVFVLVAIVFVKPSQTSQCEERVAGYDYIDQITSIGTERWNNPWSHYNNNYHDCWLLRSELGGKVQLTFDFFQLQAPVSGVCTADWLKVYDGDKERAENLMFTYCGSQNGTEVTSTGAKMLVIFSTDESITDIGFRLFFVSVDVDFLNFPPLGISITVLIIIICLVVVAAVITLIIVLCVCKKTNNKGNTNRKVALDHNLYEREMSPSVMIVTPLPMKT